MIRTFLTPCWLVVWLLKIILLDFLYWLQAGSITILLVQKRKKAKWSQFANALTACRWHLLPVGCICLHHLPTEIYQNRLARLCWRIIGRHLCHYHCWAIANWPMVLMQVATPIFTNKYGRARDSPNSWLGDLIPRSQQCLVVAAAVVVSHLTALNWALRWCNLIVTLSCNLFGLARSPFT